MRRDNVLTSLSLVLLAAMLVGCPVRAAWAGGLWMYEHGSPDVGNANAGVAARAEDASTAANNPAGMARLEKAEVMATIQPIIMDIQFRPGAGTTTTGPAGDGSVFLPSGGLFYVQPLGQDWRMGLSLGSYMGLGAKYEDDWVGRYYVQESAFLADSFGVGGGAGILVEPRKGTRFGLTYVSPVEHEFTDTPQFSNATSPINQALAARTGDLKIKLTIPQSVMFSVYSQVSENWALMGNLGWQNWTQFGYTG